MNLTTILLIAGLALLAVYFVVDARTTVKPFTNLANVAGGAYENGVITRTAEEDVTTRYLLGKKGAADGSVLINGAADEPLYIIEDEPTNGNITACAVLGNARGLRSMVASGAIAEGESIVTDAGGKIQSEANAAAGSYFRVGVAMQAADADGDQIVVSHHKPEAVTVS